MSLVIKLNGVIFNNPNLPTLTGASLVAGGLVDVERDAIAHYLLGGGTFSYQDMTASANNLVPVNNDPVINASSIETTFADSLNTGITFGAGSAATLVCVYKNNGVSAMPLGSMESSSGDLTKGIALFSSADGSIAYVNGQTDNAISQIQLTGIPQGHVFLAASIGGDQQNLYSPQAAGGDFTSQSAVGANAEAPRSLYVGAGHYSGTFSAEVCEVIVFDKVLTQAELEQVYSRSKYRMAKRGINI